MLNKIISQSIYCLLPAVALAACAPVEFSEPIRLPTMRPVEVVDCTRDTEPVQPPPYGRNIARPSHFFGDAESDHDRLYFFKCSADIDLRQFWRLEAIVGAIRAISDSNIRIIIEGHAGFDEATTHAQSIALGERRAAAVRDHYVSQGIPASRIVIVSYGWERLMFYGVNTMAANNNARRTETYRLDRYVNPFSGRVIGGVDY